MRRNPQAEKQPGEEGNEPSFKVRNVPTIIPLRDLIVIIGALFTLGSGYFTFESKLTILEHDFERATQSDDEFKKKLSELESRINQLDREFELHEREFRLRGNLTDKKQN